MLSKQNLRIHFTDEEDKCLIRLVLTNSGRVTKILRHPDTKFHPFRGRSALRQRTQVLKLISS